MQDSIAIPPSMLLLGRQDGAGECASELCNDISARLGGVVDLIGPMPVMNSVAKPSQLIQLEAQPWER